MSPLAKQIVAAAFGVIVLGLLVAILMTMTSIRDGLAAIPDEPTEPEIPAPAFVEDDKLLWKEASLFQVADGEVKGIDLELQEGEGIRLYSVLWAIRIQQTAPAQGQLSAVLSLDPHIQVDDLSSSPHWLLSNEETMPQVVDFVHAAVDMASAVGTVPNAFTEFHDFSATPIDIFVPELMLAMRTDADSKSVAGVRIYYKKIRPTP